MQRKSAMETRGQSERDVAGMVPSPCFRPLRPPKLPPAASCCATLGRCFYSNRDTERTSRAERRETRKWGKKLVQASTAFGARRAPPPPAWPPALAPLMRCSSAEQGSAAAGHQQGQHRCHRHGCAACMALQAHRLRQSAQARRHPPPTLPNCTARNRPRCQQLGKPDVTSAEKPLSAPGPALKWFSSMVE